MAITHILQQNCKGIQNLPFSVVIFKNEKSSGGSTFVLVLDGRSCCDESGRDVIVSVICLDNYTYKSPQFPIYIFACACLVEEILTTNNYNYYNYYIA